MRSEILVILCVMAAAAIIDWACLVMASKSEESAEIERANMEKEKKRNEHQD